MSAYFGNRPCLDAAQEYENCQRLGYPLAPWWRAANSFVCPLGPEPGRGVLLMQRGHVVALDATAAHDLVFRDSYENEVRLRSLVLVRSWAVTPGWRGDQQCAHWVEVADKRYLAQAGGVLNKGYNLRSTAAAATYFSATKNGGSAWTWTAMVADIWAAVGKLGAYPGLPFTPDGTPEGFAFHGIAPYAALAQVLDRIACALKYDPVADTFSIVRQAATDSMAAAAFTYHDQARLWDAEPYETARGRYPQYVRVYFARQRAAPDSTGDSPLHAVDVADPSGTVAGTESGTYAVLYDDLPATYDSGGSLTNSAALTARATERATDFYRLARLDRLHRIYDGGYRAAGLRPGAQVQATAWRDLGDGLMTEVSRRPGLLGGAVLLGDAGASEGEGGGSGAGLLFGGGGGGNSGASGSSSPFSPWATGGPWSFAQQHSQQNSYALLQQLYHLVQAYSLTINNLTLNGPLTVAYQATPSTPATGYGAIWFDSSGNLYAINAAGVVVLLVAATPPTTIVPGSVPQWFLVDTITHADLTLAATGQTITAYTIPAKVVVHAVFVRTRVVGSGGGVTSISIQIDLDGAGPFGTGGDGMAADNVEAQATFPSAAASNRFLRSWSATSLLQVTFGADVNVADLTGGEWDVYALLAKVG